MTSWTRAGVAAMLAGALSWGCGSGESAVGEAEEAVAGGYYVANVKLLPGSCYSVEPRYLIDSTEAWGPQTLLLSVDRQVSPQITIQQNPGLHVAKDKLTRTLQEAVGFSLSESFEVTASSSTVVDEGCYQRLEAYPTFQKISWDLWNDVYGAMSGAPPTHGTVYRPMGVYFRVVTLVEGPNEEKAALPHQQGIIGVGQPLVGAEAIGLH